MVAVAVERMGGKASEGNVMTQNPLSGITPEAINAAANVASERSIVLAWTMLGWCDEWSKVRRIDMLAGLLHMIEENNNLK